MNKEGVIKYCNEENLQIKVLFEAKLELKL